jgi:hypothetical protein
VNKDTVVRWAALSGVIAAATVLSYVTLKHRAEAIGFPHPYSFFYPLAYDALILGASRTWQNAKLSKGTRQLAKWITLVAIVVAIAAFVAEFAPHGPVAVLFAIVIPASLASALVITSRAAADRQPPEPEPKHEPTLAEILMPPKPAYTPIVLPQQPKKAPKETHVSTNDKRAWVHAQLDAGVEVTGPMIDKHFSNGSRSRNGARLLKSVLEERARV